MSDRNDQHSDHSRTEQRAHSPILKQEKVKTLYSRLKCLD